MNGTDKKAVTVDFTATLSEEVKSSLPEGAVVKTVQEYDVGTKENGQVLISAEVVDFDGVKTDAIVAYLDPAQVRGALISRAAALRKSDARKQYKSREQEEAKAALRKTFETGALTKAQYKAILAAMGHTA